MGGIFSAGQPFPRILHFLKHLCCNCSKLKYTGIPLKCNTRVKVHNMVSKCPPLQLLHCSVYRELQYCNMLGTKWRFGGHFVN